MPIYHYGQKVKTLYNTGSKVVKRIHDGNTVYAENNIYINDDSFKFWYDSILNTKNGHSPIAKEWSNLQGSPQGVIQGNAAPIWGNNYLTGDGATQVKIATSMIPQLGEYTIEIALTFSSLDNQTFFSQRNKGSSTAGRLYILLESGTLRFARGSIRNTAYAPVIDKGLTFSLQRTATHSLAFVNGKRIYSITYDPLTAVPQEECHLMSYNDENYFKGKLHCTRVYHRALSENELMYNFNFDKERFNIT